MPPLVVGHKLSPISLSVRPQRVRSAADVAHCTISRDRLAGKEKVPADLKKKSLINSLIQSSFIR